MKRIASAALLLGLSLAITGCQKPGGDNPANESVAVPEGVDGEKVAMAVGRALWKGMTGTSAQPNPTPDYQP